MDSLVLELQREAYQQQTSVSILLRKAYTLSRKLKVQDFTKWAELELNGYKDIQDLPDYRVLYGELKAFNPYNGYIPVYFFPELENLIKKKDISETLTEVELLVKQGEENGGILMYKFPTSMQKKLMEVTQVEFEISLHMPVSSFNNILDKVRNMILDWTLKLEEEGILGEGMTFSEKEKKIAFENSATITNHIGTMVNSQLQQNTTDSVQSLKVQEFEMGDLKTIIENLEKFQDETIDLEIKQELASEIEVLRTQVKSPKPKWGIIKEALKSVQNIAENAAGSLLAAGIIQMITMMLSSIKG